MLNQVSLRPPQCISTDKSIGIVHHRKQASTHTHHLAAAAPAFSESRRTEIDFECHTRAPARLTPPPPPPPTDTVSNDSLIRVQKFRPIIIEQLLHARTLSVYLHGADSLSFDCSGSPMFTIFFSDFIR